MDSGMSKLLEVKLFGDGLVVIDTPELLRRYNECLESLGVAPTNLQQIRVDGIGWSPEVAEERHDSLYLCAGEANQRGIIITPDQKGKPLYYPVNSFDRDVLRAWFERHQGAVAEITAKVAIGLDFVHDLTSFQSVQDLLLVKTIEVCASANGLIDAAREQNRLVQRFEKEPFGWFDRDLRQAIIKSGEQWGDLRHHRVDIPPFRYEVGNFFTSAFGGVFVFRSAIKGKPLLVVENEKAVDASGSKDDIRHVNDPGLVNALLDRGLVESSVSWYAKHLDMLLGKLDCMLVDTVCAEEPDVDYADMSIGQKRQRSVKYAKLLRPIYHELERVVAALRQHQDAPISAELRLCLLRPSLTLDKEQRKVVWKLLCRMDPSDPIRLYLFDRNTFYDQYRGWSSAKQDWAIQRVVGLFRPEMRQVRGARE